MNDLNKIADETGVEVKGFSAYSQETPHYNLPIVEGSDTYSPLTTWNNTMTTIDEQLFENQTAGEDNKASIGVLENETKRQDSELEAIRDVDKIQSENIFNLTGSVQEIKSNQDKILKDLVEQNAMVKSLQNSDNSIVGELGVMKIKDTEQDNKLDYIESKVGAGQNEGTIEVELDAVSAKVDTNKSLIDAHWNGSSTPQSNANLYSGLNATRNDVASADQTAQTTKTNLKNQIESQGKGAVKSNNGGGVSFSLSNLNNVIGDSCDGYLIFLNVEVGSNNYSACGYRVARSGTTYINITNSLSAVINEMSGQLTISVERTSGVLTAFVVGVYNKSCLSYEKIFV